MLGRHEWSVGVLQGPGCLIFEFKYTNGNGKGKDDVKIVKLRCLTFWKFEELIGL